MKKLLRFFPRFVLFSFVVSLSIFSVQAIAVPRTWTGTNSGSWSNAGNWGGAAPDAGDDLVFPDGASNLTNVNDFAGTNFNSITFNGASGGYDLGSNALTLGAGGITTSNTSGFNTITLNVTLGAPQTFALSRELRLDGDLNLGSYTLIVNNTGTTSFFQGAISGSGDLVKNGAGDLTLSGAAANTYAGTTTVIGGRLRLHKLSGTDAIAGPLVIQSGGTVALDLDNEINDTSTVTVNGTGALDLQVFGPLTETIGSLSATGNLLLELDGPTAGSGYSQLNVTGNVNITGATLGLTLGFVPIPGQTFTIINNIGGNPVTGTFAGLPEGSHITVGASNFTISYAGGTGNDVVLTAVSGGGTASIAAIPALSGWMLAVLALLLLGYGVHVQRGRRRG